MANERDRRRALMQEAIDSAATTEALRETREQLAVDADEEADLERLRRADLLLRAAPQEAAPQHLALKIMAALAQRLSPERWQASSASLAIGLAAIALLLTPLLAVLGWLVISAISSASILGGLFGQVTLLVGALIGALESIADGAQMLMQTSPEAAVVLLGLIPIAVLWLIRFRWHESWNADDDATNAEGWPTA